MRQAIDTLGDPPHPKAILVDAADASGQTLKNRILLENYYLHHGHVDVLVDCRGNQESLMVAIVGRKVGTAAAQAAGRLQFTADAAAVMGHVRHSGRRERRSAGRGGGRAGQGIPAARAGRVPSAGICSTSCRNDQTVRPPVGKPQ